MAYEITLKPREDAREDRPVTIQVDGYYIDLSEGKSSFSIGRTSVDVPTDKIIKVKEVKPC